MKLVVSDAKGGLSGQLEVPKSAERQLVGIKIGEVFDGSLCGLDGYKLKITGGTDKDGFPMRADIHSHGRVKASLGSGAGVRKVALRHGARHKKTVAGNAVVENTMQVNARVEAYGPKKFEEIFPPKPKAESEKKE